jgi:hypothetical protein
MGREPVMGNRRHKDRSDMRMHTLSSRVWLGDCTAVGLWPDLQFE